MSPDYQVAGNGSLIIRNVSSREDIIFFTVIVTIIYGVVFVIAHETGKVLDSHVMSKECQGCRQWEGKEDSEEYLTWKTRHQCEISYTGSFGGMEPYGMSILFML